MIESINFRVGVSGLLLDAARSTIAEFPDLLYAPSNHTPITGANIAASIPPQIARHRQRWLIEHQQIDSNRPTATVVECNPVQWLLSGNPRLSDAIVEAIGDRWQAQLEYLQQLAPLAESPNFQARWRSVKLANKCALARTVECELGIGLDVNTLFDLHLQPIGGHQRQLLTLLYIISLYARFKRTPQSEIVPRTFIFSGDLASAEGEDTHSNADAILGLIDSLAQIVAADADVRDKLHVVYIPPSLGLESQLYAAADVWESIATAVVEDIDLRQLQGSANGAISIGSLGKTNYWLEQCVGAENCFRFGLAIPEIELFKEYGYDPYNYYKNYPQIRRAIDALLAGHLTPNEPSLCRSIVNSLLGSDEHLVLADYIFYVAAQERVSNTYRQISTWTQMSILNAAGVR